jgi:hypothetical protein
MSYVSKDNLYIEDQENRLDQENNTASTSNFNQSIIENQKYKTGLENQIRQLAIQDPIKYMKYQGIGESLMNCSYDITVQGFDLEGDIITAKHLLYTVRDYILDDIDLAPSEIDVLIRVYGTNWRSKIEEIA